MTPETASGIILPSEVEEEEAFIAGVAEPKAPDTRTPPWKTPAGRARKALLRRRKAQRQARKANR